MTEPVYEVALVIAISKLPNAKLLQNLPSTIITLRSFLFYKRANTI